MIKEPTVFILGAGSSKPYGFPDGKTLLDKIKEKLLSNTLVDDYIKSLGSGVPFQLPEIRGCISGFLDNLRKSNPMSIDEFLSFDRNQIYVNMGKFLIAAIMNEADRGQLKVDQFCKPEENWYQSLKAIMLEKTNSKFGGFLNNNISFITFNYDATLEEYFSNVIDANWGKENETVFFDTIPIKHIHGCLKNRIKEVGWDIEFGKKAPGLDWVGKMAGKIKLVHENEDYQDKAVISSLISKSKVIVFLGFHFHMNNLSKLGFINRENNIASKKCIASGLGLSDSERDTIRGRLGFNVGAATEFPFVNGDCKRLFAEYDHILRSPA